MKYIVVMLKNNIKIKIVIFTVLLLLIYLYKFNSIKITDKKALLITVSS